MIGYKLVGDITVSSAQTSVSFTGLNITKADQYMLMCDVASGASSCEIYLTVNANNTLVNYYSQRLTAADVTYNGARTNNPKIFDIDASVKNLAKIQLCLANSGYFNFMADVVNRFGASNISTIKQYGGSTFTAASITTLTITASVANMIAAGSRFRLYKLTAKKVADITVGTATTQVNITGLSIDKTSEYVLVSDLVNTTGNPVSTSLFANGNNTGTNYYTQRLEASSTTLSATRYNTSYLVEATASSRGMAITDIKVTNNGYFVFQSDVQRGYGTSSNLLQIDYCSSTFTVSSITSLTVSTSVSNGIGVGSRFTLYKLI